MPDTSVAKLSSPATVSTDNNAQTATLQTATLQTDTSQTGTAPVSMPPPSIPPALPLTSSLSDLQQLQQNNSSLLAVVEKLRGELEKRIATVVDEDDSIDEEDKAAKLQTITEGLTLVTEALQGAIAAEAAKTQAKQLAESIEDSAKAKTIAAKETVLQIITQLESTIKSIKTTYTDSFLDQPIKITPERINNLRNKTESDLKQQTKALGEAVNTLNSELHGGLMDENIKLSIPEQTGDQQTNDNWKALGERLQGPGNWTALGALLHNSDNWTALASMLGFNSTATATTQTRTSDNWSMIQSLLGFSDSTLRPPTAPPPVLLEVIPSIVGEYENHLYDKEGKNDWHYVTINRSETDSNSLRWTNRAEVAWTLTPTDSKEILAVGEDCPYFAQGHTHTQIKWENGQVTGLTGPGDELYDREQPEEPEEKDAEQHAVSLAILGEYENHLYDQGGKNDWHYVAISRDETNPNRLRWTNRAGVSWTLTPTDNKEILAVGEECPYFTNGYTQAQVKWEGDRVIGLMGPGNEPYDRTQAGGTSGSSPQLAVILAVLGGYENHLYDTGGKNDWHYVTISQDPENNNILRWTNRAGASWTLTPTNNKEILLVGKDCPYYSRGHTQVQVKWENGKVTGLLGPSDELYSREASTGIGTGGNSTPLDVLSLLIGQYENHLYDTGGKNDWHYVTVSRDPANRNILRWTNRAGVSWTLTPTLNKEILTVGKECPYFGQGYTQAQVQWNNTQVMGLLGPGDEMYNRELPK